MTHPPPLIRLTLLAALIAGIEIAAPVRADLITGRVLDLAGQPVNNADFDVFDRFGNKLSFDTSSRTTGKYDLEIAAGRYDLVCEPLVGSGLAPQRINGVVVAGTLELNWTLPASVRQLGRVLGPGDRPLAGALLDFDDAASELRQPVIGDVTSPFGTFAAFVESGIYRITVTPGSIDTALAPTRLVPRVVAGTDTIVTRLVAAVHLMGRLRDELGSPLGGGRVTFDQADTRVRQPALFREIGLDGFYRSAVEPGTYRVTFEPPLGSRLVATRSGPLTLSSDLALDVSLTSGFEVTGTLTGPFGEPVVDGDLDVVEETSGSSVVTPDDNTDERGSFRLVLPAGRFRLTVSPPSGSTLDTLIASGVTVTRDTTLQLRYDSNSRSPVASIRLLALGNPSARRARFALQLPNSGAARVEVFSPTGRAIRTLADRSLPAGTTQLDWDGRDQRGNQARTGVYLVRARANGESIVTRIVVLP
ncbi:MAG: hypothetical protein HOP12_05780 [Candidatus Eisenbacteria bacterium]|uniref:FlgD/Vpr Ig-like domain-containing protein n=1 Tax=Eiseniibacteriota bacterium TaxID=2212470 RepID=A0A849SGK7_UNCEI|nr:hypothetical protein [Candidatus Eisenbacteria bacterium]